MSAFHDRVGIECGLAAKSLAKLEAKECDDIAAMLDKFGVTTEAERVRQLGARLRAHAVTLKQISYDAMGETQPIDIEPPKK